MEINKERFVLICFYCYSLYIVIAMRNQNNHNMKTTKKVFGIYNVAMDYDSMTCRVTKDAPKARFNKIKPVWAYRFRTAEQMTNYYNDWFERMENTIKEKEARKNALSAAKKNMVNPFFVGQIFYDSWGYDQTNIDFYQVTEVGKKSVKIRPIAQRMVEAAGFMCEYVAPLADEFIGEEQTKIVSVYLDRNNQPQYHITSRHGWISKWGNREKIYQSHYA